MTEEKQNETWINHSYARSKFFFFELRFFYCYTKFNFFFSFAVSENKCIFLIANYIQMDRLNVVASQYKHDLSTAKKKKTEDINHEGFSWNCEKFFVKHVV